MISNDKVRGGRLRRCAEHFNRFITYSKICCLMKNVKSLYISAMDEPCAVKSDLCPCSKSRTFEILGDSIPGIHLMKKATEATKNNRFCRICMSECGCFVRPCACSGSVCLHYLYSLNQVILGLFSLPIYYF